MIGLTEAQEQKMLFAWAGWMTSRWPELELMHHVANEGKRSLVGNVELNRQGRKKGVPDICLPVARKKANGLYIELKRQGGRLTPEQKEWLERLREQGYHAAVAYGWEQAREIIEEYLG